MHCTFEAGAAKQLGAALGSWGEIVHLSVFGIGRLSVVYASVSNELLPVVRPLTPPAPAARVPRRSQPQPDGAEPVVGREPGGPGPGAPRLATTTQSGVRTLAP
jgi:hypothetical protein